MNQQISLGTSSAQPSNTEANDISGYSIQVSSNNPSYKGTSKMKKAPKYTLVILVIIAIGVLAALVIYNSWYINIAEWAVDAWSSVKEYITVVWEDIGNITVADIKNTYRPTSRNESTSLFQSIHYTVFGGSVPYSVLPTVMACALLAVSIVVSIFVKVKKKETVMSFVLLSTVVLIIGCALVIDEYWFDLMTLKEFAPLLALLVFQVFLYTACRTERNVPRDYIVYLNLVLSIVYSILFTYIAINCLKSNGCIDDGTVFFCAVCMTILLPISKLTKSGKYNGSAGIVISALLAVLYVFRFFILYRNGMQWKIEQMRLMQILLPVALLALSMMHSIKQAKHP